MLGGRNGARVRLGADLLLVCHGHGSSRLPGPWWTMPSGTIKQRAPEPLARNRYSTDMLIAR